MLCCEKMRKKRKKTDVGKTMKTWISFSERTRPKNTPAGLPTLPSRKPCNEPREYCSH